MMIPVKEWREESKGAMNSALWEYCPEEFLELLNAFEELEQANMALTAKLRQMHRRAQKAEGQRDRAIHEVEAWQRVFGGRWSVAHHLAMSIVNSIQKVLTK